MGTILKWWIATMLMLGVTDYALAQSVQTSTDDIEAVDTVSEPKQNGISSVTTHSTRQNAEFIEAVTTSTNQEQLLKSLSHQLRQQTEDNRVLLGNIQAERSVIEKLMNDLKETQRSVTQAQLDMTGRYRTLVMEAIYLNLAVMAILVTIFAIIGGPQAIKYFELKFEKRQKRNIRNEIGALITETADDTTARCLGQYGYVSGKSIFDQLRDYLHEKNDGKEVRNTLSLITSMAEHSLECVERLRKSRPQKGKHVRHVDDLDENILNIWIFYRSFELLMNPSPSNEAIEKLLERARELHRLALSKEYSVNQVNRINTSNFAFLKFGNTREQDKAKNELIDLFERKSNVPPISWRKFAYAFYFPHDENDEPRDLFEFGSIPKIPDGQQAP